MLFDVKIRPISLVFELLQIKILSNSVLIFCFLALEQTESDVH